MFAGPNGSGKSTLFDHLRRHYSFPWGHYLNPDELDRTLRESHRLEFGPWDVNVTAVKLKKFIRDHPLAAAGRPSGLSVRRNVLRFEKPDSTGYFAAIISDFLRREWLTAAATFTFETVMSAPDKVELLAEARQRGYRTYLYYVCTENPTINEHRILNRRRSGGHAVPPDKIRTRYARSLEFLPRAIQHSNRAFLFDNSERTHRLVAEFENGRLLHVVSAPPRWLVESTLHA